MKRSLPQLAKRTTKQSSYTHRLCENVALQLVLIAMFVTAETIGCQFPFSVACSDVFAHVIIAAGLVLDRELF